MRVSRTLMPAAVLAFIALAACDDPEPLSPSAVAPALDRTAAPTAFEVPYAFELDCPQGYLVTSTGIATGHQQILPAGGTPERSRLRLTLRGELTNTTSGRTVRNDADFTIFTDLSTGESTVSGGQFHVVAKGAGIVILDAGTIRFDAGGEASFEAGRHDFLTGEFEALQCELLS